MSTGSALCIDTWCSACQELKTGFDIAYTTILQSYSSSQASPLSSHNALLSSQLLRCTLTDIKELKIVPLKPKTAPDASKSHPNLSMSNQKTKCSLFPFSNNVCHTLRNVASVCADEANTRTDLFVKAERPDNSSQYLLLAFVVLV